MSDKKNLFSLIVPDLDFLILQSLAIIVTAMLLKKMTITSLFGPLITVIAISWVNNLYWDSRLFFDLPSSFTLTTIGLIFCNSIILWIIVKLAPGIEISGLVTAIKASVILSISSYLINKFCSNLDWMQILQSTINFLGDLRSYFLTNTNAK